MHSEKIPSNSTNGKSSNSFESSTNHLKPTRTLTQTIRYFTLFICTCALMTNWLRFGLIYLFPKFCQVQMRSSLNFCIVQSFSLHVLTYFHLHLIIFVRLFWHYCFMSKKSWQTITHFQILFIFLFILLCLCLFTLPSISNEWASIIYDPIIEICIINYLFNYSYTLFVLIFTCLIPLVVLVLSHKLQMKSINSRISRYMSEEIRIDLFYEKVKFQYSSYIILIWSLINILLAMVLHIPIQFSNIRIIFYHAQSFSLIFDPLMYIVIFRSLSLITLLRPLNDINYV